MRTQKLLLFGGLLFVVFSGCQKEYSSELYNQIFSDSLHADTLPANYPFATGYCSEGSSSLGVTIVDTSNFVPSDTASLPDSILLEMPVPGNQGSQGSCTSWAVVYGAANYYLHITRQKAYSDTGNLSPKFIYNQISKGNCGCTSFLDNLYLLKTEGACSLSDLPYNADECSMQPNNLQKALAQNNKIKGWKKVNLHDLTLIKRAIEEKKPVLFSITTDQGFNRLHAPYIWKQRKGELKDGHAMIISGYDDEKNAFRIMNSWGTSWGDKGFAWIDYQFFLQNVIEGGYVLL
jgi:C1A family cysteine protease